MRKDKLYLAATITLLAISTVSSIAAFHFYAEWSQRPADPKGSLSDDGSQNIFSNSQFWDQYSVLTKIFSSNYTLPGQL